MAYVVSVLLPCMPHIYLISLHFIFCNIFFSPQDFHIENDKSPKGETYIPIDWSLKTKVRFISPKPFAWSQKLRTCEEASGITGLVNELSWLLQIQGYIKNYVILTFIYLCIVSITLNDDQQDATKQLYLFIYSQSALHVLGDVFAHHQEHVTVFTFW